LNLLRFFRVEICMLTAGVDTLVGGAGNDVFNASNGAAALVVLGGLDTIDGGAGTDTLNVVDTAGAAITSLTVGVKNVETINFTTNNNFTGLNIASTAGLTKFVGVAAAAATASDVTAANTTDVSLTVAGTSTATVYGGKVVSVVAGTGNTTVGGATLATKSDAITSVTVKGGGTTAIDNASATAVTATGTTLTDVTLNGVGTGTSTVGGAAVTTLTLQNQKVAAATTITNATSTALTVNVDGVGYDAAGTGVTVSVAAGVKAATLNVNATGAKSAVTLTGTVAKTVNITGSAALDLVAITTATKIDGSAATGNLQLNTLAAGTVDIKTGAGNDKFTATTTNKITVDAGAGNDTVTLSGALVAGSTVNLGAGNDTLLGTAVAAAATLPLVTTINGGDGTDSVSTALINAGNAAQFTNFENLSLQGSTLDVALMTGSTITGLSIDAAATTVLSNATQAMALTVNAGGTSSTIGFTGVTGTADAYSITFAGTTTGTTASAATVGAGTVVIDKIENVTINSGSTAGVNVNTIALTDSTLQTLTITGSQAATVTFAGTTGTVTSGVGGVSLIDGSAATGKLGIDLTTLAAVNVAVAGLTVKGGAAVDTLTTAVGLSSTLTGNAGNDVFVVAATVAGAGTSATPFMTTITDFTKGDTLTLGTTASFTATKISVATATNFAGALDLAAAGTTAGVATWFQYGGNTYIVDDLATATTFTATEIVVKLVGTLDLSTSTLASNVLTFA
jgi:S-layer protein